MNRTGKTNCYNNDIFAFMRRPWGAKMIATAALAVASLLLPSRLLSDNKSAKEPENETWNKLMALSVPDENHQLLNKLVGTWVYKGKETFTDSDQKTTTIVEFGGTLVRKSLWGGRYFVAELTGDKTKMPWLGQHAYDYKAMGIDGYDNEKKKFFLASMDNMLNNGMSVTEGTYEPATNTIVYQGEREDSPGAKIKFSIRLKILDAGHYTVSNHFSDGYGQVVDYVRRDRE